MPFHVRKGLWRELFRYGVMVIAGFLLPIGLSVVYFGLKGNLQSYFDFGLLYNFKYISDWGSPFKNPITIFLFSLKGRALVLGIYLALLFWFRNKLKPSVLFVLVWFGMTLFALLLSLRPYPHYFIQIVPPVVLMLGFLLSEKRAIKLVL